MFATRAQQWLQARRHLTTCGVAQSMLNACDKQQRSRALNTIMYSPAGFVSQFSIAQAVWVHTAWLTSHGLRHHQCYCALSRYVMYPDSSLEISILSFGSFSCGRVWGTPCPYKNRILMEIILLHKCWQPTVDRIYPNCGNSLI